MQRWDQVSWRSGGGGGVQASTGSQPGSGKVIPEVFWSRLRQGSRAGSPGIILPCYKLKRKPVKVVGEGMCPIHTDPSGSTFLPSFMLKTPDLSPSAQAWRDYGGGAELTSGSYSFREVTLGMWNSCVSSELVEL